MRCGAENPADPQRSCVHFTSHRHATHNDGKRQEDSTWPNAEFVPTVTKAPPSKKGTKKDLGQFLASGSRVRRTDPETSHQAAIALGDLRPAQREVYGYFVAHGEMMDEKLLQAAERAGSRQTPSGLRSRRDELAKFGLLVDTGRREKTENNRDSIVWGLAES